MLKSKTIIIVLILSTIVLASAACGGSQTSAPAESLDTISISELPDSVDVHTVASIIDNEDVLLLDVREQWEYDEAHIPGVTLIPMGEVASRLEEIPANKEVIVTCRSGNRSGQIAGFLRQSGFDNVHNMTGGILEWQAAGYSIEP